MKKKLPEDAISRELAHSSVFFQKAALPDKPAKPHSSSPEPSHSPAALDREQKPETRKQALNEGIKQDIKTDVILDVVTSLLQGVDLKEWQEVVENTETQNSALRLTSEERYAIEDVVNELRRKYGIKTFMNEVARLGLMLIIHDFKRNKKESMIHKVKKA